MPPLSIDPKMDAVSERIKRFLLELKEETGLNVMDYGCAVRIGFRRFLSEYEREYEDENTESGG